MLKDCSYKTYITNSSKSHIGYVENNIYKGQGNRTFNNTSNIFKHINQYSTDAFNNYKIHKTHNVQKTYDNSNNDVFIVKHNTMNANDTYNMTKNNRLYNVTGNNYYTKKEFLIRIISPTILQDITITIMNTM